MLSQQSSESQKLIDKVIRNLTVGKYLYHPPPFKKTYSFVSLLLLSTHNTKIGNFVHTHDFRDYHAFFPSIYAYTVLAPFKPLLMLFLRYFAIESDFDQYVATDVVH